MRRNSLVMILVCALALAGCQRARHSDAPPTSGTVERSVLAGIGIGIGIGIELFNVPWSTVTQRDVEPSKLARVSSLDFFTSYGLAPLGLAPIAPAIDTLGATAYSAPAP